MAAKHDHITHHKDSHATSKGIGTRLAQAKAHWNRTTKPLVFPPKSQKKLIRTEKNVETYGSNHHHMSSAKKNRIWSWIEGAAQLKSIQESRSKLFMVAVLAAVSHCPGNNLHPRAVSFSTLATLTKLRLCQRPKSVKEMY